MAKNKNVRNVRQNLQNKLERFKEKKIQLVRENPDTSIVYVFNSPVIRERFSKISREVPLIKDATIDLWGYLLDNEDKRVIEEKFTKVIETAKKIIDFSKDFGEFDYTELMTKKAGEKIRLIQTQDSPMVEVFVPKNGDEDTLFEALFRIDTFDTKAKRDPQKADSWIALLKEYEAALKELKETAFNIFKAKIRAKHLTPYGALRFEFKKWVVTQNENAQE